MTSFAVDISCIILAGGEGKRVGGVDKGLIEYRSKALIEYVIEAVQPQVDDIVISANRNLGRYQSYSNRVISDESEQYLGPLAGISAALPHCTHDRVLVVPCDTPFLPKDIVERFLINADNNNIDSTTYIAESNDKLQPVMLIHKNLLDSIIRSLEKNELRLMAWIRLQKPEIVCFSDEAAFKSFNHTDDFKA